MPSPSSRTIYVSDEVYSELLKMSKQTNSTLPEVVEHLVKRIIRQKEENKS